MGGARLLLLALLATLIAAVPARADYVVGAAHRSLNPTKAQIDAGTIKLGGYGVTGNPAINDRHATGILAEGPQVGAFAVGDGAGGAVVIANMQVQGWFAATRDGPYGIVDMRRAAAAATGLRADQIFIQSDHSHSGADAMGVWGGVPLAFRKTMFDQTVKAITAAWEQREPAASLVYGTANAAELLSNQFAYDPANAEMDDEVRVLQARDEDGDAIASMVNFSAHATVLGASNTRISGDWVQRADPVIADAVGGEVVTTVGTLGRSQPKVRDCDVAGAADEDLCKLDHYARLVRDKVELALEDAEPVTGPVASRSYLVQDASSNPFLLGLLYAGSALDAPLNRSITPPWMTGNVIGTTTGTALIGDVLVSSVPGEIYPQIARAVRDAVGAKARGFMTFGLGGDQLGYIIAPFPGAYVKPICATLFEDCTDTLPLEPGALPNDNYVFNVSPTMGERVTCSLLRGADELLGTSERSERSSCTPFANDAAMPEAADTTTPADAVDNTTLTGSGDGPIRAGVGKADASWHVGASAGQYASTKEDFDPNGEIDPSLLELKNLPSYGLQSRLQARALVVEGSDGVRHAIVKNDLYIPQDLLWRRTAQILAEGDSGITQKTLTVASTHDHSSPYYSSTGAGAWTFQDVFDVRFFEYYAQQMAKAVEAAADDLQPARIGASTGYLDKVHRHSFGPATADDGTPAGYPVSDADHTLTVVRVDTADGKPLGMLVNYSLHGEGNDGNDLISADWVAPLERMVDRETGAMMVFTQSSVGTAEPERSSYHDISERLEFTHRNYAQLEYASRLIADETKRVWAEVDSPDAKVPFASSMPIREADRWFPGPLSHPVPTVSNCRFDVPAVPVAGLPDCERVPLGDQDPGVSAQVLKDAGLPVPENVSAPSYGALEEDVSVHMQALRLGEIVLTMCSCEQWADQARNIRTRTDTEQGNQYLGWNWPEEPGKEDTAPYRKMRAQVNNDAAGWDSLENVPTAESEPSDPALIKGNYTHEELAPANGYALTVPLAMTNDYNGYIATYREYQRGDHYRKALTAWGPHSSDYFATRLVQLAGHLKTPDAPVLPGEEDRELADSLGRAKTEADQAFNDAKAQAFGEAGETALNAYPETLPDDGGEPGAVAEPDDVERFAAALFTWRGGSNFTDDPRVVVQRRVGDDWEDYADQSGEVPVTVRFPRGDDDSAPDYAQGSFDWKWTATFEAFVSPFDTGDRGRATPPGEYRFVVHGRRRTGGAVADYEVTSRTFTVSPWSGITSALALAEDGTPVATVGPIDYPDSYEDEGRARFITLEHTLIGDQRFCFTCTFRPWEDYGEAASVAVTITRADGSVEVVDAVRDGDGWRPDAKLGPGDSATVAPGGVLDAWGNDNGAPSNTVGVPAVEPSPSPSPEPSAEPSAEPTPAPSSEPTPSPAPAATGAPTPAAPARERCGVAIRGTADADRLTGTDRSERITGRGGNDRIRGGRGPDCLSGGRGNDHITGNGGRDRLDGGPGDDRLFAAGSARDVLDCGPGRDIAVVDRRDTVRRCEVVRRR